MQRLLTIALPSGLSAMWPKPKLIGWQQEAVWSRWLLASLRPLLSQCYMLTSVGAMLGKRKTQQALAKRLLSSAPILDVQQVVVCELQDCEAL